MLTSDLQFPWHRSHLSQNVQELLATSQGERRSQQR